MSITAEQWDKAIRNAKDALEDSEDLPLDLRDNDAMSIFFLLRRYRWGERTEQLYNELVRVG